jgi:hypothetical protein
MIGAISLDRCARRRTTIAGMRVIVLSLLIVTSASRAAAQAPLLFDPSITVGAGASLTTAAGAALAAAEDRVVPVRLFDERGLPRRAANIVYRFFRFSLFDLPQEDLLMVANHEVVGHGGRLRERFDGPISYRLDAPPPYGNGGGATYFSFDREPGVHELLAISAGGMEANGVAADRIATAAVDRRILRARDAMRYLEMRLDTARYVLGTSDTPEAPGHDVSDFVLTYNALAADAGTAPLKPHALRREVLVTFADPMIVYSAYAIGRYLAVGDTRTTVPMLRIGAVRMLPSLIYRLTPFGTEWGIGSALAWGEHGGWIEFRSGRATRSSPWGGGVRDADLAAWRRWRFSLSAAELWRQPPLALDAASPIDLQPAWGGAVSVRVRRTVATVWGGRLDAVVDVGGKTGGFIAGEPLERGPVVRFGVALPLGTR